MAVITISRQIGAGGWTLGKRLSKRLGYRYVNEGMIIEVARKVGVSSGDVRAFEKEGATKLMRFIDRMVSRNFIDRLISDKYGYLHEKSYVEAVRLVIQGLYKQGNMVIIGRGSQYILKGYKNAWHILLVAELGDRVRFLIKRYQLTEKEAQKAIEQRDEIRRRFLAFFSDKESHDDPLSYDLVLNMSRLSVKATEQLILRLIS